ncbi:MAG TPA: IS1182 family transposase [Acidobacteriaceae bacterium]
MALNCVGFVRGCGRGMVTDDGGGCAVTRWAEAPEQRNQLVLFSQLLDDSLPREHSVRLLDEILSRLDWSRWEAKYHAQLGQPAIHPRVLASVLLYGLQTRIRSSRGLEEALFVRVDFRWLAEGRTIDHTTLSEFRRKHAAELKELFVQVVQLARRLELVSLERLGFDATRVRANNRRTGTRTPEELRKERDELAAQFEEHAQQAAAEDARDEELFELRSTHQLPEDLRDDARRREQIEATLVDLAQAQAEGRAVPKRVPITDLESRVMPNKDGGHAPNYTPLATVDIASGLIVAEDVLNVVNEDGHLVPTVEDVRRRFDLAAPPEVLTDGLNGTGANLAACAERGISLISPCEVPDPAKNPALRADPTQAVPAADWDRLPVHPVKGSGPQLDKSAFVYDAERNCYWCPLGQPLTYRNSTSEACGSGRRLRSRYQAEKTACAACPLRARCLQGKAPARQINREQHEPHRERHAQKMATPEARATYALRRHPGERPFAVIKHQFGLRQFLLRGLAGVRTEWGWAATAFNLHRLMSLLRSRAGPRLANVLFNL